MIRTISYQGWEGVLGSVLAERELACLIAVAAGHTDKEIAQRDGLSPRSVKGRLESAMHKLGVYRRPALVAEAMRRGLISPAAALALIMAVSGVVSDDSRMKIRRSTAESKVEQRVALRRCGIALAA